MLCPFAHGRGSVRECSASVFLYNMPVNSWARRYAKREYLRLKKGENETSFTFCVVGFEHRQLYQFNIVAQNYL